jgi:transcriptional regulatory protein LevR
LKRWVLILAERARPRVDAVVVHGHELAASMVKVLQQQLGNKKDHGRCSLGNEIIYE